MVQAMYQWWHVWKSLNIHISYMFSPKFEDFFVIGNGQSPYVGTNEMDFLVSWPRNYHELFGDHLGKTIIYLMDVRNNSIPKWFFGQTTFLDQVVNWLQLNVCMTEWELALLCSS